MAERYVQKYRKAFVEKDDTKALCAYTAKVRLGRKGTFKINASETQRSPTLLAPYVAMHSPFKSMDHLGAICNSAFKGSKAANFTLHRTKCTKIINLLAPHFIEILLKDLGKANFNPILDEGTDISVEKLLGVVIRYDSIQNNKFVTTFLGLIDIEGGKAGDLLQGLERLAKLYKIDLKKLLTIGTDNAYVDCLLF